MPPTTESTLSRLAEGDRCFGRFVLGHELGSGAVGVVWLARDEANARNVALKFLPQSVALDSVARAELKAKVEQVRALHGEAFAQVFELIEDAGRVAVSSEFVPGITFANLSGAGGKGRIEPAELGPWMEQLGRAFEEADRVKLVHGALHPGHLVVTREHQIKVLDFGIARTLLEAASRHDRDLLRRGPAQTYASPQLRAGSPPTPRDDVYALGGTLRDLLAKRRDRLGSEEQRDSRHSSLVTAAWEETIRACLAEDPAQRPPTIAAMVDQLSRPSPTPPQAALAAAPPGKNAIQPTAPSAIAPEVVASNSPAASVTAAQERSEANDRARALPTDNTTALDRTVSAAAIESQIQSGSPGAGMRSNAATPVVTTFPEIEEARAVAAQRTHHQAALVAFAGLGIVWFGLRILAERVFPPAIPPPPKAAVALIVPASGSVASVATPDAPPEIDLASVPALPLPTPVPPPVPPAEPARMLADARDATPAAAAESHTPAALAAVDSTPRPIPAPADVAAAPAPPPIIPPPPAAPVETPIPPPAAAIPPPTVPAPSPPSVVTAIPPGVAVPSSPALVAAFPPASAAPLSPAVAAAAPAQEPPAPVATPGPRRAEPVPSSKPPKAGQRWTNSLGMPFAPLPKLPILVAIWETRVRDFDAFVKATGGSRKRVGNEAPADHPVTEISFLEATRFCEWLTATETASGRLTAGQHYRVPTDAEWSAAAGIPIEPGPTLRERDDPVDRTFPWGHQWPPPPGAGNFRGVHAPEAITDADIYEQAAPVGMFAPNRLGLFDLGGNAAEMVSDLIAPELGLHATRGASFADGEERSLRLRARGVGENDRGTAPYLGFRVVLDLSATN